MSGTDKVVSTCQVKPGVGIVTWDSEGTEGGKYHSRKLHVPTESSGLTIGRGYDLRSKNSGAVVNDLTHSGLNKADAEKLAKAVGLKGEAAKKFIIDNKLADFEITQCSQKILFDLIYEAEAKEAARLCEKPDVATAYGKCDWDKLHPAIQEMVVDLKFRGDYTPSARKIIQKSISENDLKSFVELMCDKSNWKNVPKDRFERRKNFLSKALAEQEKEDKLKNPKKKDLPNNAGPNLKVP